MKMEIFHCQTVAGVQKELAVFALVYNLVRRVMEEAGRRQRVEADRVSFLDALRWLRASRPGDQLPALVVNPHRPGPVQPRVRKRRPKQYPLMTRPRAELRKALLKQRPAAKLNGIQACPEYWKRSCAWEIVLCFTRRTMRGSFPPGPRSSRARGRYASRAFRKFIPLCRQGLSGVGPSVGMRQVFVVIEDVRENPPHQVGLGAEVAAADHPLLQDAKPNLNLVQPTAMQCRQLRGG